MDGDENDLDARFTAAIMAACIPEPSALAVVTEKERKRDEWTVVVGRAVNRTVRWSVIVMLLVALFGAVMTVPTSAPPLAPPLSPVKTGAPPVIAAVPVKTAPVVAPETVAPLAPTQIPAEKAAGKAEAQEPAKVPVEAAVEVVKAPAEVPVEPPVEAPAVAQAEVPTDPSPEESTAVEPPPAAAVAAAAAGVPALAEPPKTDLVMVMPAVYAHEVLRCDLKIMGVAIGAGDMKSFKRTWIDFQRFNALHGLMKLACVRSESHAMEVKLAAAVSAALDAGDLSALQAAYGAYLPAQHALLDEEERILLPTIAQLPSPDAQAAMIHDSMFAPESPDDVSFFVMHGVKQLSSYGSAENAQYDATRIFVTALQAISTPAQWETLSAVVKATAPAAVWEQMVDEHHVDGPGKFQQ